MAKRPGSKILRVGLFQNDRLLEECWMRKPGTVTIGHDLKRNHLVVPASNLPRTFSIFAYVGGRYFLQFTDQMDGKISRRGEGGVQSLQDLVASGTAKKKGSVYQVPLDFGTSGRIRIADAAVIFQFVTPPPIRPRPVLPASMKGGLVNSMERPLALILGLSALIQVGFVVILAVQDWPVVEEQEFQIPDRMARIFVPVEPEEPEPVDQEPTDDGDQAVAEDPPEQTNDTVEEATPEEIAEARQEERIEVTERVRDTTIVGTLTALGEDGRSVVDRLVDNVGDISTEEAFEGAQRVEVGSGARTDVLGRRDGSPDAGGGGLAEGEEINAIGGSDREVDIGDRKEEEVQRVDLGISQPDDVVGGSLDTAALNRSLRQLSSNIEACYRDYLRTNQTASGTVRVLISITARGSRGVVQSATVALDEVSPNNRVGQCVANQLQSGRVRLPPPEEGDVQVTVPFHFAPGG